MTARVDNSILLKKKNLFLKTDDAENLKFSWQDWAVFLTQVCSNCNCRATFALGLVKAPSQIATRA